MALFLLSGGVSAFTAPAGSIVAQRTATHLDFSRSTVSPIMMGAKTDFVKNLFKRKEDKQVTDFRSQLAGMDSLSGLSDLKLEREEKVGRTAGVWKEYIKADGRVWYYNTETKIQTWVTPDEIKKLDAISAAAAAKNEAR